MKNKVINYIGKINKLPLYDLQGKIDLTTKQINHYARLSRTKEIKNASVETKKELLAAWDAVVSLRNTLINQKNNLNGTFSLN